VCEGRDGRGGRGEGGGRKERGGEGVVGGVRRRRGVEGGEEGGGGRRVGGREVRRHEASLYPYAVVGGSAGGGKRLPLEGSDDSEKDPQGGISVVGETSFKTHRSFEEGGRFYPVPS